MSIIEKNKINISQILEYFLAFLLMLSCNSVYSTAVNADFLINECLIVVTIFLCFVNGKITIGSSVKKTLPILLLVLSLYFVIKISKISIQAYILNFFVFFPCMVIYISAAKDKFSIYKKFSSVVFIISTLSTIVWFLSEIVPVLSPTFSVVISWGATKHVSGILGLFFRCQRDSTFGFDFFRNTGLFAEAPMHSLVLSIALIYELFLTPKVKKKRVIPLIIYIFTTVSATGILCIMLCAFLCIWKSVNNKKKSVRVIYILFVVFFLPVMFMVIDGILETKSATNSYTIRMIDYIAGFNAWKDNPIFGVGYGNNAELYSYKFKFYVDAGFNTNIIGFSNSIMSLLGQGGIVLFTLYLLPFLTFVFRNKSDNLRCWSISLIMLLITTIFHTRFIMIYLLALSYILFSTSKREVLECEVNPK